ncbi:MAG: hypothetical protein KBA90_13890 [Chitinophagaceae bacterium]|nr:hypothetical protein [Chitinophagaceae bacterium]MBP7109645.1 hypothetical protein [Chitinophagaceae bacterium]
MKSKVLLIQQFFGLGDQLFAMTIAHDYIKEGYKVLWPVLPSLVEGLNRAYPKVTFIDYNLVKVNYENREFKEFDGVLMLPMRYSERLMNRPYKDHMISKYEYLKKDWKRWKHTMFERDYEKENKLVKHLGIDREPYNLVSTIFGSNAEHKIDIKVNNEYRNIEMQNIPGFSLFDWSLVIENAATIHAVSSASLYLFELLTLVAKEVHIYNRTPIEKNLDYVRFLFSKNYILHE